MLSRGVLIILLLCLVLPAYSLEVATWNVKQLGDRNPRDWRRTALVIVKNNIDFVALQEVLSSDALMHLEHKLEGISGESWSTLISEKVGTGSNEEHYAFAWRDAAVEYIGGAILYVDPDKRFVRPPFAANFKTKDGAVEFTAANIHIRFGKSKISRTPEVRELKEYWRWLTAYVAEGRTIFLGGNLKLEPKDNAYTGLRVYTQPVITKGHTTLSEKDGQYVYLHDNWWISRDLNLPEARIIEFPSQLGISHNEARKEISDHAPVVMSVNKTHRGIQLSEEDKVDPLKVLCVNPDPPGRDERMLHEEYIVLQNLSPTQTLKLAGYRIEDYEGNAVVLQGELPPTGKAAIASTAFGYEVWNNDTDTIYVYSPEGKKIAKIEYENISNDPYMCTNTKLD